MDEARFLDLLWRVLRTVLAIACAFLFVIWTAYCGELVFRAVRDPAAFMLPNRDLALALGLIGWSLPTIAFAVLALWVRPRA